MAQQPAITLFTMLLFSSAQLAAQEALTIGAIRALAFGSLVAGAGGSVTVSPAGQRTAGGAVILVPSVPGHAAEFSVQGDPDATFYVDLPADSSVRLAGPGTDISLTDFQSEPAGANGLLNSGGTVNVSVGATLGVGSGQSPGDYSGSFTVIVNYN